MDGGGTDPAFWMQYGRPIIAAVMLALLWTIESLMPMFIGRRRRLSHMATNLGLAAANSMIAAGCAWALLDVTEWARARRFGLVNLVVLPTSLHWCAAIVLFDIWQYWWHRFNHRMPL
jgi:sterol desaturase/sphingolipid hydroxylase (fatty acid hydroxylase superfamily)